MPLLKGRFLCRQLLRERPQPAFGLVGYALLLGDLTLRLGCTRPEFRSLPGGILQRSGFKFVASA
jgi:hypothetical protein